MPYEVIEGLARLRWVAESATLQLHARGLRIGWSRLEWTRANTRVVHKTDSNPGLTGAKSFAGRAPAITSSHPFWTQRGRVTTEELALGDVLKDKDAAAVAIRSIAVESRDAPTFNLSVDGTHTFFVMAGSTSVLVHNIDPWDVAF